MHGIGSGKVIDSGPNDHVFVYFADHGAPGLIAFPSSEVSGVQSTVYLFLCSMSIHLKLKENCKSYKEAKFCNGIFHVDSVEVLVLR